MNMLRVLAKQNIKYYKRRNILIGIAVFLTAFLIFITLAMGVVFQQEEYAAINAYYPDWHGQYYNITKDLAEELSSCGQIERHGVFSQMAFTELSKESRISYRYAEEEALDMLRKELSQGRMPQAEDEIVLEPGAVEKLGKSVALGGKITLPYQVYRNGAGDYIQEKEFTVTGFLDGTESDEKEVYIALVTKELLEKEVPAEQIFYQFLFRIPEEDISSTDEAKSIIKSIAAGYGIPEDNIKINSYNLIANHINTEMCMIIFVIICIVALAGSVTMYSIYYIGTNERIQEYGRLKVAGMTSVELKKIVLWEGRGIVKKAAPYGILAGIIIEIAGVFLLHSLPGVYPLEELMPYIPFHKFIINHLLIMVLAFFITYLVMRISIRKSMRIAGKITGMEALRYPLASDSSPKVKSRKKSLNKINVFLLVKNNLANNKKRSIATIMAMSVTGFLVMVAATIISCTDARHDADDMCYGQYMISQMVQFNNKEHPEREWQNVVPVNPLTEDFLKKIKHVDGVEDVICFDSIYSEVKELSWTYEITGVREKDKSFILDNISEGSVTYDELKTGDKVVLDWRAAKWHLGGIKIGDKITYTTEIGGKTVEKQAEVAAMGTFPIVMSGFFMASESFGDISQENLTSVYSVWADEDYNEETANKLNEIIEEEPLLLIRIWQEQYDISVSSTRSVAVFFYIFLGILGCICAMNMINTMISSVQRRKKEIGMLQAVGMTDRQLFHMLQLEGGYYILGTLIITVAGGTLISYPVYILARDHGILGVYKYQFPFGAVIVITLVLAILEIILAALMTHSVKKETIIDRIRFSE